MLDPLLIGLGLLIGTLVGLTGVGGGALLTPLLILVIGVRPITAIGTDLAFAAITKTVGAFQHKRQGDYDLRLVSHLALGSIPGALFGAQLISLIEATNVMDADVLLHRVLGIALLVSAGANLLRAFNHTWAKDTRTELSPVATACLGAVIGIMVGSTSIGAGSLLMAVLALLYGRLPVAQSVGVDVMHGAILAFVASIAHGAAGHIEVPMLANLLMGSLPGVLLGSWLCSRLPGRPLRVGIAAMLAISGARLL